MNKVTEELLKIVSDYEGKFDGAFNIREDGACVGRQSSANVKIESRADGKGLEIHVKSGTQGEKIYIPACVTHSNVKDKVYNDFFIGENADVTIIAGCGVHSEGNEEAHHNGIHRFVLAKGAHVLYKEKHVKGAGNPQNRSGDGASPGGGRGSGDGYYPDRRRGPDGAQDRGRSGGQSPADYPRAHYDQRGGAGGDRLCCGHQRGGRRGGPDL